ncbi:hypothetical protein OQZ33_23025 [Pedobacter sp. MC2016-05]|uniref:alpha-1,3-galactosidase-related protein n=1 Tax=Pedobacter sp. MC2016-05 TaxID=2994474 RepID=UPI002247A397|nr:hypothetical protein [Pedobacter sp. MC2016-05]MCX2477225.1 hypothetical protein [Pedobacter sp. MC2016-05]
MRKFSFLHGIIISIILVCLAKPVIAQNKVRIFTPSSFGIMPNTGANATPLLSAMLKEIKSKISKGEKTVIQFEKGRYDFFPQGAAIKNYYISNHDQSNPKTVGIEIEQFNNILFDGSGSNFIFHGRMLPISLIENHNITLKGVNIDFEDPQIAQIKVIENDTSSGSIVFETAPWVKYEIKDSIFYNIGEGWKQKPVSGIAFEAETKHIVYNSGDVKLGKGLVELHPGQIKANNWKNKKLIPGTVIALRSWARPNPGIFVHKGKNVHLKNVRVHYAEGMGLLAQLTENIDLDGFSVRLKDDKDPRYFTTQADATHFSSCKGIISSKNGIYEGMMDDAINVHGTYLKLIRRLDDRTVIGKYMHGQSYGFDWGYVGDSIQFIRSKTMDYLNDGNVIAAIDSISSEGNGVKEFKIVFQEALPQNIDPSIVDYGIENLSWTPTVSFTKNIVRNNRARGALFSTPKKTVVANNLFDHTSGSAIVLCGDSNGWYETGACKNITIKNNKFINSLTSMYQFTNAIISIYPEIPDLINQKHYFHSGIRILNNTFETFDQPILYAKSVDGLNFSNNRIKTTQAYPPFHKNKKRVLFERVVNSRIQNNIKDGKAVNLSN